MVFIITYNYWNIYKTIYTHLECSWHGYQGNIIGVCFGFKETYLIWKLFRNYFKSDLINSAEGHHKNGYKEVRQCWNEWIRIMQYMGLRLRGWFFNQVIGERQGKLSQQVVCQIITHRKNWEQCCMKSLKTVTQFPCLGIIESYRGSVWDSWPRTAGVCRSELQPSQKRFLAKWSQLLSPHLSVCLQLTDDCGEDDEAEGQGCKYHDNQVKILQHGDLRRLS